MSILRAILDPTGISLTNSKSISSPYSFQKSRVLSIIYDLLLLEVGKLSISVQLLIRRESIFTSRATSQFISKFISGFPGTRISPSPDPSLLRAPLLHGIGMERTHPTFQFQALARRHSRRSRKSAQPNLI